MRGADTIGSSHFFACLVSVTVFSRARKNPAAADGLPFCRWLHLLTTRARGAACSARATMAPPGFPRMQACSSAARSRSRSTRPTPTICSTPPTHGLLRSKNGGRDWVAEAPQLFHGPTLAVAFAADGKGAWAATPAACSSRPTRRPGASSDVPDAAMPAARWRRADARPCLSARRARRVCQRGWRAQLRARRAAGSARRRWARAGRGVRTDRQALFAVLEGASGPATTTARSWRTARCRACPPGRCRRSLPIVSSPVACGPLRATRCTSATTWAPAGALGASRSARALSRSTTWPRPRTARASCWPLTRACCAAPTAARPGLWSRARCRCTWKPGRWSPTRTTRRRCTPASRSCPTRKLRRRAEQGANLLSQLDPISVAGAGAFLLLLLIGGGLGARKLAHAYRDT